MRKISILLAGLLVLLLLTGCYDRVELENRQLVLAMGIDREGEDYKLTVLMPSLNADSNKQKEDAKELTKSGTGRTLAEAIDHIEAYTSRSLYLGQVKLCILSKEVLSSLNTLTQELEDNKDLSRKIIILETDNKASELLGVKQEGEPSIGLYVPSFYKNNEVTTSFQLDLEGLLGQLYASAFVNTDRVAVIPKISFTKKAANQQKAATKGEKTQNSSMQDNDTQDNRQESSSEDSSTTGDSMQDSSMAGGSDPPEEDKLEIKGAVVVKNDQLIGELDESQMRAYLLIQGEAKGASIEFDDMHLKIYKNKTDKSLNADGLDIHVYVEGAMDGPTSGKHSSASKDASFGALKELMKGTLLQKKDTEATKKIPQIEESLMKDIENIVDYANKLEADIFYLNNYFWKHKLEAAFNQIKINPQVKVEIIL